MMDYIILERPEDGVAVVRLNRPQVWNALNLALQQELAAAFEALASDESVRAIVLTGDDRAFSSGADLTEYVEASTIDVVRKGLHALWASIADCPKPVIAAVNGCALGGGCELAMHADIIVAGESAQFGFPEVRIGVIPGAGATQRLTRAVGKFRAMRLLLTGRKIGAAEALPMGLVSEVVPDEQVLRTALALAGEIAGAAPLAVRAVKELVLASMNGSLDGGLRRERKTFELLFSTTDKTEGLRAALEKRAPRFEGR
jgi:enoyl-CoA hydratase